MSKQTPVPLEFEGEELEGVFVGRRDGQARPTVMLIPTVMGVSDLELGFAKQLVELGYNAFVADLFGKKFRGAERDVMFGEMTRLGNDRVSLRRRLLANDRRRQHRPEPVWRHRTLLRRGRAMQGRQRAAG